jgi:hypothetical protein
MFLIDPLAEARIAEAMQRGDFTDLPGFGKPLYLADDSLVPEVLRAACRILKNSGHLPPELELHREINDLAPLMTCLQRDSGPQTANRHRWQRLMLLLNLGQGRAVDLRLETDHDRQLCQRFTGRLGQ